jgi:preprotein translocase subunit SecA
VRVLARVQVRAEEDVEAVETQRRQETPMEYHHDQASAIPGGASQGAVPDEPFVREGRKVGRNEACPCGSGKKFKQCHGKLA